MEWSKYFQSPRYLEITRKYYLSSPELYPLIWKWLGLEDGMTVLDVGCGSGFFTRLVAEGFNGGKVCGIDMDLAHITEAKKIAEAKGLSGKIEFSTGDAYALPFPDNSFDLVTSHTFYNVAQKPKTALREMMRVAKASGRVASLDNMTLGNQTWHTGYFEESAMLKKFKDLEKKVLNMYQTIYPLSSVLSGLPTSEMPHFFATQELQNVRVYAQGRVFSLSNAAMVREEKEEYINCMCEDAVEKVKHYWQLPQVSEYLSVEELEEYIDLLAQKRDYLLSRVGENSIWEWHGGANLLTVGDVVKQ